jgi:hypothetical protein
MVKRQSIVLLREIADGKGRCGAAANLREGSIQPLA